MELSEKELEQLRNYKNKPNEDVVRYKQLVKEILLKNDLLIHLLNNEELEEQGAENDEYFNINILPYYIIAPTQTDTKNYVCFEVQFTDTARYNPAMKECQIVFYVFCHQKDIIEPHTGSARHDLLSAVLIDRFQGCNDFGTQLKLVSDRPNVIDTDYAVRTLVFEQHTPNSLTRNNGKTFNLRP